MRAAQQLPVDHHQPEMQKLMITSHTIGEVPTMKIIETRPQTDFQTGAYMNFQTAAALACFVQGTMSLICTSSRICMVTKLLLDKIFI